MQTKLKIAAFAKVMTISLLSLLVSACGFELRGYNNNHLAQAILSIKPSETIKNDFAYRHFERTLKSDLKNTGAELVTSLSDTSFSDTDQNKKALQIILYKLSFSSQGISRDGTGRANEQEVSARLDYQLNFASDGSGENEKPLLSLSASSNYFQDYRNPAAGEVQKKQTQTLLMQQLSQSLIRQIEFEFSPQ